MPSPDDPRRTGPSAGDGRNISPGLGLLEGEGAGQKSAAQRGRRQGAAPAGAWGGPPPPGTSQSPGYYDRPVLKEPVWIWAVPVYFFTGGAAGAAAVLGESARLLGSGDFRRLSFRCRRLAAGGTAAGAALLIYDLGRPQRFFNMLRVFRPTSAMSVGSWVLAASGTLSAAAAVLTPPPDGRLRDSVGKRQGAADLAAAGSAVLGLPLASYTAVLLSDTAVPLWQQIRKPLPGLFVSSAAASAAALLKLARPDRASAPVLQRFGMIGTAAELGCALAVQRRADEIPPLGRPLTQGLPGSLWKASKLLSGASLGLALAERRSRAVQAASALGAIAAGLALRFAVFHAGKESARDPRATFGQQRSGAHNAAGEPAGLSKI